MNVIRHFVKSTRGALAALGLAGLAASATATAVTLADEPVFASGSVPGNLTLALSVEWPTATTPSYHDRYSATAAVSATSIRWCYRYVYNSKTPSSSYFAAQLRDQHACASASTPLWAATT
jgi:type IV pilus assembly protein PilY1